MEEQNNAAAVSSIDRYAAIILALDKSGSMSGKQALVYQTITEYLRMMAKLNETSLDFEYRVLLLTFDSAVNVINPDGQPLPPQYLLEMFEDGDYVCSGGTSLAAVFRKIDSLFSRKAGGLLEHARKGDAAPTVIYISDIVPTDKQTEYNSAKKLLLSNRYYEATKRLCVFLGPESKRSAAAELVGSSENVLAMGEGDQNLEELLLPILWGSSIMMADGSHISGEQSTGDLAREQKERAELGKESAENLKDFTDPLELEEELKKLFKLTEGGA